MLATKMPTIAAVSFPIMDPQYRTASPATRATALIATTTRPRPLVISMCSRDGASVAVAAWWTPLERGQWGQVGR